MKKSELAKQIYNISLKNIYETLYFIDEMQYSCFKIPIKKRAFFYKII